MADAQLVCDLGVQVLPVDGAAVLTRGRQDASALMYATDPVIARLDDLEFVTGEGPCLEAYWNYRPVLEPDLASGSATARWPWFAPEAVAIGASAVFAFPLHTGDVEFGVFWLFRRTPGGLTDREVRAAQGLAQTVAAVVLTGVAANADFRTTSWPQSWAGPAGLVWIRDALWSGLIRRSATMASRY